MASQPHSPSKREQRAQLLDRLLRSEGVRLARHVRFHSERDQDAEDALGDACVQFLRFYEGAEGTEALRWMFLVSKRCAWAISRRRRGRESLRPIVTEGDGEEAAIVVAEERAGPAELAERSAETARIIALIERLRPDERTALILFGLGCSYAEIAELRGWSYTKVNRSLSEGRARIRRDPGEEGESS